MEMIAMLGGLGATQPGFSPEGAAFASQISNTKNVAELMVVVAAIDSASLRPDEKSALKVIAMEKRDSFDSIFRKPWYWVTVAAVLGVAWWKRDAIKRVVGLSGLGGGYKVVGNEMSGYRLKFDEAGTMDYDTAERECNRINDVARSNRAFRTSSAARGACTMCGGSHPCTRSH